MAADIAIEVCVDSLESALEAERGGADRLELCSALSEGGVTPSHGLIHAVCRGVSAAKVFVLVRPRAGDFLYSCEEVEVMRHDVLHAADCGARGVVLGVLTSAGEVDVDRVRSFKDLCGALGLELTFHRAFDVVRSQQRALEDLVACGVKRVLTSGGAATALQGLTCIESLVRQAGGRISVMPGGGLTEGNVAAVVKCSGATEVHGSFSLNLPSGMQYSNPDVSFAPGSSGDDGPAAAASLEGRRCADGDAIARIRQKLASVHGPHLQH